MKEESQPNHENGAGTPPEIDPGHSEQTDSAPEIQAEIDPGNQQDDPTEEELHEPVPVSEEQFMDKKPAAVADDHHEDEDESDSHEPDDFSSMPKDELVTLLENYVGEVEVPRFKARIAAIRDLLSQTFIQEQDEMLARFIEEGGLKDDFQPPANPLEERFRKALRNFHKKRSQYQELQDKLRKENLEGKRAVLDQLKDLIQNEDNMNKAFERFHELQSKWRSFGAVPSADVQDLQLHYKFLIDKFYDYIKINKELQELDQRHNLETKISLCEQAEELLMEQSINTAFRKLHMLQDKWRETGPVPREKKNEIWDRFKSACDQLFDKRREYIGRVSEKRKQNLESKNRLCEQVEGIKINDDWKHKEWQEATATITEIQTAWKKIGQAEHKANDAIWNRFKAACDVFYKAKSEFYQRKKQEFSANLQLKTELCIQAEALQNSTDWKATTAELKRLQDEWKKTGHVGERQSEKIWKRFRTACDTFFKNKSEHFSSKDKEHDENLVRKNELISRIENYQPGENFDEAFEELKSFQREWSGLGMVPLKSKDTVNKRYKEVIDEQFEKLKKASGGRHKFHSSSKPVYNQHARGSKPAGTHSGPMDNERRFLMNKIAELKNDVQVWENNIGFFAKSKNAEKLKQEFEEKISKARQEIESLRLKLDEPK